MKWILYGWVRRWVGGEHACIGWEAVSLPGDTHVLWMMLMLMVLLLLLVVVLTLLLVMLMVLMLPGVVVALHLRVLLLWCCFLEGAC